MKKELKLLPGETRKDYYRRMKEAHRPHFMLDENHGIRGEYGGYSLLEKRICNSVDKNGNPDTYNTWITCAPYKYADTLNGIFNNYKKFALLKGIKAMDMETDFSKIAKLCIDIDNNILSCLSVIELSDEMIDKINKVDTKIQPK